MTPTTLCLATALSALLLQGAAASAESDDEFDLQPLRDSRIFAIDFGNSTTSLASLSAWSSLIAIKAKIAVIVAIFWALASLFHKYIGSVSLCRSAPGYHHSDHHSIGDLYGSAAYSHPYQDSAHSYSSYSTPISGRPGRVEMEEELSPSGFLKEMVAMTKERLALADVVFGAINDDDCRRRLLCWASSAYSDVFGTTSSASSEYSGGSFPFSIGDGECSQSGEEDGGCPASRLTMALSALTKGRPDFDA